TTPPTSTSAPATTCALNAPKSDADLAPHVSEETYEPSILDMLLKEAEVTRSSDERVRAAHEVDTDDTLRDDETEDPGGRSVLLSELGTSETEASRSHGEWSASPSRREHQAPGSHGSTLRQQADATRRAFDRADALVSLAQAYLRG